MFHTATDCKLIFANNSCRVFFLDIKDILNFILNPPSGKVEFVMEVTDKTRADVKVCWTKHV